MSRASVKVPRKAHRRRPDGGAGQPGACAKVSTDGHSGYARVPPEIGAAAHNEGPASEAGVRLEMVNARHQRLKRFLARFASVSTRRLSHYLAWFEWAEQIRCSDSRPARTMSSQAAAGHYESTRAMPTTAPQPFWVLGGAGLHVNGGLTGS